MKKSVLYSGIGYLLAGVACTSLQFFSSQFKYDYLIWGLGCGFIGSGLSLIYRYFYWSRPKNAPKYEAKMKEEQINLNDERKIMLRDKSGRIAYIITFGVLFVINMVFTYILRVDTYIFVTLWLLLIFMYVCGVVVFYYLDKKL